MQQIQKKRYGKSYIGLAGTAWIAGLLMAGSDSQYMPWPNGVGLLLFFGASILLGKLLNSLPSNPGIMFYPKFHQKWPAKVRVTKTRNRKINIRYALSI